MAQVEVLETTELGDRSYVVHDGTTAVVVDPQRDIDRVEGLLVARGLALGAVAETHLHNDYVSGGAALARRAGVDHLVCADDDVAFRRRAVRSGDELRYGGLTVRALHTPGHTFHHLSYVAFGEDDDPPAVFTGGSLLYGSVGRTDLLGPEHAEELTREQFRSARRLSGAFDDDARIFPTHGFGSFCSAGSTTGADRSTMGEEREQNDALTAAGEDGFVEELLANLTPYPDYYTHMGERNAVGPERPDLAPAVPVDPERLRASIRAGEWVVDLRSRRAYAAGHVSGTVGIELESDQFSTYLGWLMPWDTPVTLIGSSSDQVARAQRQMVRIGIERPGGAAVGRIEDLADGRRPESYPRAEFGDLAGAHHATVLDVRQDDERQQSAIPGSLHVPIHRVPDRTGELPRDAKLWVHCASGFRASIAASLLARDGHDVVLIDDEYTNAVRLGLAEQR
ncbi:MULTISPECIES: MBL fold metallo-hydrolase [unclassified Nocardioides]|uniref:MBL fold metallo-hydrolase n=1 Tax=unclassified Nocardioides TaxID=2615069 RepID=UPI000057051E|nr:MULTISPECIES: MBL fold metallo-hydrolase [unclassified Nocardioides]ABL82439.1 beta-lactamase domain protein [Nocardioides sp. JS614]